MKVKLYLIILMLFMVSSVFAQSGNKKWSGLDFLVGNWEGEGSGKPGEGSGYFSFKFDLDNNVLVRNSHSEYPAAKDKAKTVHDDLMIIYSDNSGSPAKAIYFDNEGHVINYSITFPNDMDVVFTGEKIQNSPSFRLTYSKLAADLVNVKFEISRDGVYYITYIEGKSKRIKQ